MFSIIRVQGGFFLGYQAPKVPYGGREKRTPWRA